VFFHQRRFLFVRTAQNAGIWLFIIGGFGPLVGGGGDAGVELTRREYHKK
jgi:hypothetical protein